MATTVLGLKTFAASDPVDYNEINDNYNKIDNGVKTAMQGRAAYNLLDNSDFTNPVNQRGATSYSSQWAYSIDRWYLPGSTVPVTVGEGYVSFNAADQFIGKAITNGYYTLAVKLLDGRIFVGSAYYTAGVSSTMLANNGVVDGYLMGDAGSGNHPRLRIQTVSGEALSFVWAALYEGAYDASTLPAYQPKGYAAELAECMRYYQIIPEQTSCAFSAYAQSEKYFASSINFPQMRITPTVSLKTDSNGYIGVVQGVSFVSTSEFDFAYKINGALLPATTNANYAGKVMSFYGIELSADL